MDSIPKLELGEFEYWQDSGPVWRGQKKIIDLMMKLIGVGGLVPPIKQQSDRPISKEAGRHAITNVIGLDDPVMVQNLEAHWKRTNKFIIMMELITLVIVEPLALFVTFEILVRMPKVESTLFRLFESFLPLLLVYVVFGLVGRIVYAILSRYYADSLAARTAFLFIIDLMHERALSSYGNRRNLQSRLISLSQNVLLLGAQFKSKSQESDEWISSHFKKMEQYIVEHEKLIVAPKIDSLDMLRQDFYALLKILIGDHYGDFNPEYQPVSKLEQTRTSRIVGGVLGLLGLVVPALILYILYTDPSSIEPMGVNIGTITLIALAWFLLTIDANLKLGIVERITGLAKAMRDLG